ncbi:hypothetical protein F9K33_07495 [bacterium]|nr:MAG: hypothetical protein F9K33_07495 [bacterium]
MENLPPRFPLILYTSSKSAHPSNLSEIHSIHRRPSPDEVYSLGVVFLSNHVPLSNGVETQPRSEFVFKDKIEPEVSSRYMNKGV